MRLILNKILDTINDNVNLKIIEIISTDFLNNNLDYFVYKYQIPLIKFTDTGEIFNIKNFKNELNSSLAETELILDENDLELLSNSGSGGDSQGLQSVLDTSGFSSFLNAEGEQGINLFEDDEEKNRQVGIFSSVTTDETNHTLGQFNLGETYVIINSNSVEDGVETRGEISTQSGIPRFELAIDGNFTELSFTAPTIDNVYLKLPAPPIAGTYTLATLGDISSTLQVEKTILEIYDIIAAGILDPVNGLIPGAIYKITGVHPALYDDGTTLGTTIYLRALTPISLTKEGHGEFWNPKYNKSIDGYGIWTNLSSFNASNIVGTFNANELITANNGATGKLFNNEQTGLFLILTGDWSTAISITGNVSGTTADIGSVVIQTYSIGDKVIWGGYSWTNVNGLLGNKTNSLTLNSEWIKNIYSTSNYNQAYDIIEYDYDNDLIIRRYEVLGDNDVVCTKNDIVALQLDESSINVFQFGNDAHNYLIAVGMGSNKILNSYVDNINFRGVEFYLNNFVQGSYIYDNSFDLYTTIKSNDFTNMYMSGNQLSGVDLVYNKSTVGQSAITNSYISNCQIWANTFNSSQITSLFSNMSLVECVFNRSSINIPSAIIGYIQQTTFNTATITIFGSATATILSNLYTKTIYSRPDGTPRLQYYNNSDVLVIAAITD
jgi:hypothetical protein